MVDLLPLLTGNHSSWARMKLGIWWIYSITPWFVVSAGVTLWKRSSEHMSFPWSSHDANEEVAKIPGRRRRLTGVWGSNESGPAGSWPKILKPRSQWTTSLVPCHMLWKILHCAFDGEILSEIIWSNPAPAFWTSFPLLRKKRGPISRQEAISHLNLLKKNPSDEATSSWCPHPCNGPAHVSIMQRQSSPAVAVDEAVQHWDQQTQIDIAPGARETFLSVVIHWP